MAMTNAEYLARLHEQVDTLSSTIFETEHELALSELKLATSLEELAVVQAGELEAEERAYLERMVYLRESHAEQIQTLKCVAETESQRLNSTIRNLVDVRYAFRRLASKHRSVGSPICKIPPEIASKIFLHAVDGETPREEEDQCLQSAKVGYPSPLTIAAVCRSWRRVATGYSRLWARVDVTASNRDPRSKLNLYLSRVGKACPIDISLRILGLSTDLALDICAILEPYMNRCRTFVLEPVVGQRQTIIASLFGGRMDMLEQIQISQPMGEREMRGVMGSTPRLKRIKAPRMCLPLQLLQVPNTIPVQQEDGVVMDFDSLTSLELKTFTYPHTTTSMTLRFPSLVRLCLRETPSIASLAFPSLTFLSLAPQHSTMCDMLNFIGLCPILQTLHVRLHADLIDDSNVNGGDEFQSPLSIPTLRALDIQGTQFVPGELATSLLDLVTLPHLEKLDLGVINLPHPATIVRLVKECRSSMKALKIGHRFWALHESCPLPFTSDKNDIVMPLLEELVLHHVEPHMLLNLLIPAQQHPHLRSLVLTGKFQSSAVLQLLQQTPLLEVLDLESGRGQHTAADSDAIASTLEMTFPVVRLPFLRQLRLQGIEVYPILGQLHSPVLSDLVLTGSHVIGRHIPSELRRLVIRSDPPIRSLELACSELTADDYLWLLTSLGDTLESVHLTSVVIPECVLQALGIPPRSPCSRASSTGWIAPALNRLVLTDCALSSQLLTTVVKARNRYEGPEAAGGLRDERAPAKIEWLQIQDWCVSPRGVVGSGSGSWSGKDKWGDLIEKAMSGAK